MTDSGVTAEPVRVQERLNAYYYSFEPTGCPEIDQILGAVAFAGKMFHYTEAWTDDLSDDGLTCESNIQRAANIAALAMRKLDPALAIPNDEDRSKLVSDLLNLQERISACWRSPMGEPPVRRAKPMYPESNDSDVLLRACVEFERIRCRPNPAAIPNDEGMREAARANQRDMSTWPRISPGEAKQIRDDFATALAATPIVPIKD